MAVGGTDECNQYITAITTKNTRLKALSKPFSQQRIEELEDMSKESKASPK